MPSSVTPRQLTRLSCPANTPAQYTHTQLPHDHMSSATTTTSMNIFKQLKKKQLLLSLLSCIAWVVILIVYVHIFVFYVSVCPYIGLTVHLAVLVTHTHNRLTAICPGLPGWAGTRKVKPIWILLKQETVSGSGISWTICKSASHSRQITTPAPHRSVFYGPDALPATQPTASKHWRHC